MAVVLCLKTPFCISWTSAFV